MTNTWRSGLPAVIESFLWHHVAINTVLALQYPPLSSLLGLLAASIAASRLVLGLHFVSDVLAGAILGLAIGCSAS